MKTRSLLSIAFALLLGCTAVGQDPTAPPPPDPNSGVGPAANDNSPRVEEFRDITYLKVNDHESQLDVFQLAGRKHKRPVLLYFHGGGWWRNQRPTSSASFRSFLKMGFSVVNVDYRLTPVAPAPAAVQDARCVLAWVRENADRYGFDTQRVVAYGTSSGGHLALMSGFLPAKSDVDLPQCRKQAKVAAVLDFYGIADIPEMLDGTHKRTWASNWIPDGPNRLDLARKMSPITHVRRGLPPVFIVHGDSDPTVPYSQSVRLEQELRTRRVPVRLYTVKDGLHGKFSEEQMRDIVRSIQEFLTQHGVLRNK